MEEVLIAAINAIIQQKIGAHVLYYPISWLACGSPLGAILTLRRQIGGHRRVVLVGAISAKIASYDQPRHPE